MADRLWPVSTPDRGCGGGGLTGLVDLLVLRGWGSFDSFIVDASIFAMALTMGRRDFGRTRAIASGPVSLAGGCRSATGLCSKQLSCSMVADARYETTTADRLPSWSVVLWQGRVVSEPAVVLLFLLSVCVTSYEGHMVDALASRADEGRSSLR